MPCLLFTSKTLSYVECTVTDRRHYDVVVKAMIKCVQRLNCNSYGEGQLNLRLNLEIEVVHKTVRAANRVLFRSCKSNT